MSKQLDTEISKVSAMLLEQRHLRLLGSERWAFPLQLANIQMTTGIRSQMDVLMKMILKILGKLEVKHATEISELLAVESIFVEHMLKLMMQNQMVEINDGFYRLTHMGMEQLKVGTFVHDSMEEEVEIAYSPYHTDALIRDTNQTPLEADDQLGDYRFADDLNQVDVTKLKDLQIIQMIEDSGYEFIVENGQKQIEEIRAIELQETVQVVCFEFHMHDTTEDSVFIRVWNTWTGQFDVLFETELNQKEASRLRKHYFDQPTSIETNEVSK